MVSVICLFSESSWQYSVVVCCGQPQYHGHPAAARCRSKSNAALRSEPAHGMPESSCRQLLQVSTCCICMQTQTSEPGRSGHVALQLLFFLYSNVEMITEE